MLSMKKVFPFNKYIKTLVNTTCLLSSNEQEEETKKTLELFYMNCIYKFSISFMQLKEYKLFPIDYCPFCELLLLKSILKFRIFYCFKICGKFFLFQARNEQVEWSQWGIFGIVTNISCYSSHRFYSWHIHEHYFDYWYQPLIFLSVSADLNIHQSKRLLYRYLLPSKLCWELLAITCSLNEKGGVWVNNHTRHDVFNAVASCT